ncbi:histidyl-tRNA synthetase [Methanosarcina sp. 1.H.T.1A.1]|uniref:histidine--tRNA ligase n=1 Tax=unclassified Methanosarcina TaxID=2644672 RepID=UPI00062220CD|nr:MULTISPECIES: histidine--tRNA ligase [unclassified Methanosarcina]KKH50833.1 histidyl-tRNA synthetase [Methanosarcina sp. 1.H.A.2.2]KKH93573.1 histidyl-tRNA synthetase [Methanosarcina sp. 1.H.T.1A.1]
MTVNRPRGTRDFLPADTARRRYVESVMRNVVRNWGYSEIITPTFEHLDLFTLKSGEGIIGELYNFTDKGGREMTLRPELTAPVMRMYVNELQSLPKPLKLFYFENCFRYERPQKGRFREFWQFGVELIGSGKSDSDAEVIALADAMLKAVGIQGDMKIGNLAVIRTLLKGLEPEIVSKVMRLVDKKEYAGLEALLEEIGAEEQLKSDIFRLINLEGRYTLPQAKEIVGNIPELVSFEKTLKLLDAYGVNYSLDFGIARGLDYYTGMVFEVYAEGLGAQKQVCGGGSYQLIKLFGGGDVPSTGFGIGFDRIMEICPLETPEPRKLVLVSKPETHLEAAKLATTLRNYLPVHIDLMERNFKAQLTYANTINADYVIIVGEKELEAGKLTFRDMVSGEQEFLTLEEIIGKITGQPD